MATKRMTISLDEDLFERFMEVLPGKVNTSEVIADLIDMFIVACKKYGDEFILDVMCNRGGFVIKKIK